MAVVVDFVHIRAYGVLSVNVAIKYQENINQPLSLYTVYAQTTLGHLFL